MDLSLNPFLDGVVAAIDAHLPELGSCERHAGRFDLGQLQTFAAKPPAVRVAILGFDTVELVSSGERDVPLKMGLYIVTRDRAGLTKEQGALNLVEALTLLIVDNAFECGMGATDVRAQNLYTGEIAKHGSQLWGLSWTQSLRIGVDLFAALPDTAPLPTELYIGCEPLVGIGNEHHYERLDGLSEA